MRSSVRFLSACLMLLVAGCGYSTQSLLPASYRKIYVEPFLNKLPITRESTEIQRFQTSLPRLEEDVTSGLINRFIFDGHLRVASSKEDADLVLAGELIDFHRQPLRLDDQGNVEEYRLKLDANMTLRESKTDQLVWEEKSFVGDTTYFVTGSVAGSEVASVRALVVDFSRRVVERTIEDW